MVMILRVYTSITTIANEKMSASLPIVVSPLKTSGAANRTAARSANNAVDSESEIVTIRSKPAIHALPVLSMKMLV